MRTLASRLARALIAEEPAAQLAALRIVVPAMILWCPETRHAPALAATPAALRVAPEGLRWAVTWLPIDPTTASVAQAVCALAALCAILGVRARLALCALAASATYLFALSQLAGAVWHDMHLLWMAALLAASPCADALALDRRGAPAPPDARRYGAALLFARLLLACVYVFPGIHKLHTSGLAWALSDNLRNQLWWKWAEHGAVAPLRVDRVPGLLALGGLFVLAFELAFPVLALGRRTRPWAAALGLAFHLLAGALFRIPFVSLWALYVVLLGPRWFRRGRATSVAADAPPREASGAIPRATVVVGTLLVLGAAVQGARGQMRAYPFACYPTFQWVVGTEMPDLLVELERADGTRVVLEHARDARGYRTQRQWGELWSLAGVTGRVDPRRLRAYLGEVLRREPARSRAAGAVRARFYRAFVSVVPERRGEPPRRGALLADLPL